MKNLACVLVVVATVFLSISLAALPVAADEGHGKHSHGEQLGTVNFPSSCSPAAQKQVERGVALLHSFWYEEAEKQFTHTASEQPDCAMAHWGVAMSLYHQLWDRPEGDALKRGASEIAKARTLRKTDRERAYMEALGRFYDDPARPHEARATAYSNAMEKVYAQYPKDSEAGALYALSLLASEDDKDTTFANRRKAIAVLNPLFAAQPAHPGLAHYLIHSCDKPQLAPMALNAARSYAAIAPDSAHAVHMPSHIFARLGLWPEDIKSNLASIAVSRKNSAKEMSDGGHELHAMDFLSYAYLQTGQTKESAKVVEEARQVALAAKGMSHHGGGMDMNEMYDYILAGMPAIFALETRDWKQAASLEPVKGADPMNVALTYWARCIGNARLGNTEQASADLQKFEKLADEVKKSKYAYASDGLSIMRDEMRAWRAVAVAKSDARTGASGWNQAIEAMRSVADRQDAIGKGEVDLPAREMLADILLEAGRPQDALVEFEKALQTDPNRFNGLYGAAHAAELAKNTDKATKYYSQLLKNCDSKTADRPELDRVRTVMAQK